MRTTRSCPLYKLNRKESQEKNALHVMCHRRRKQHAAGVWNEKT
jgi:hypothetical protein